MSERSATVRQEFDVLVLLVVLVATWQGVHEPVGDIVAVARSGTPVQVKTR